MRGWSRASPTASTRSRSSCPFLQAALGRFCLVPVLVGDTDEALERAFAERLAKLDDGRTLFVFSSDFTHYGPRFDFQPFGALSPAVREKVRAMNERAAALLASVDARGFRAYLRETGNTICGRHGLATMLELLPRDRAEGPRRAPRPLRLGRPPGDAGRQLRLVRRDGLPARDARRTRASARPSSRCRGSRTRSRTRRRSPPTRAGASSGSPAPRSPPTSSSATISAAELAAWPSGPERERRQGVFVTLNRTDPAEIRAHGRLRGCIGQPEPTFPLYYGTVQAALDAALRDPRFEPVAAAELGRLEIEVTVLSPRKPVASWRDIRLGTHGIVLQKGGKVGALPAAGGARAGLDARADARARSPRRPGFPPTAGRTGRASPSSPARCSRSTRERRRRTPPHPGRARRGRRLAPRPCGRGLPAGAAARAEVGPVAAGRRHRPSPGARRRASGAIDPKLARGGAGSGRRARGRRGDSRRRHAPALQADRRRRHQGQLPRRARRLHAARGRAAARRVPPGRGRAGRPHLRLGPDGPRAARRPGYVARAAAAACASSAPTRTSTSGSSSGARRPRASTASSPPS